MYGQSKPCTVKYEDVEDWDEHEKQYELQQRGGDQQYQAQTSGNQQHQQFQEVEDWDNNDSSDCVNFYAPPPTQQQAFRPPANQCCPRYEPQQCTEDDGWDQAVTSCDPCNPCIERCDPCEPLGPLQMPCDPSCEPRYPCPPLNTCSQMCSPYRRRGYLQPPRRESFKPVISYQTPTVPMTSDTVYRKSFECVDAATAASCRMPPVMPSGQLKSPCGEFEKETVTKLSFQRHCCPERTKAIYPWSPSLFDKGPSQALTTQKHDFVPKYQFQRVKCAPRDNIGRSCACFEKTTVQKMSYPRPDMWNYSKSESCKPIISYKPPELPMEFETTQKMSYTPVCPSPKDDMPWARKAQYCPPTVGFTKDTINKLSYKPPGRFLDENQYCCEIKRDNMPRAAC